MTNQSAELDRCPVCRARHTGNPECSRCGADLSPLVSILTESHRLFFYSVACALNEDKEGAIVAANKAVALRSMPLLQHWCAYLNSSR